ncbi:hypothetical protein GH733_014651, partial [Mirounga leonina]
MLVQYATGKTGSKHNENFAEKLILQLKSSKEMFLQQHQRELVRSFCLVHKHTNISSPGIVPEIIQSLMIVATHFVMDKNSGEIMTVGINEKDSMKEIKSRVQKYGKLDAEVYILGMEVLEIEKEEENAKNKKDRWGSICLNEEDVNG